LGFLVIGSGPMTAARTACTVALPNADGFEIDWSLGRKTHRERRHEGRAERSLDSAIMRTFRRGRRPAARAFLATALCTALLAGCSGGDIQPQAEGAGQQLGGAKPLSAKPVDVPLTTDGARGGQAVVAAGGADAVYNYGPTVMQDGGRTRMWWCSQYGSAPPPGDDILYGEAPSADGPFTAPGGGQPLAVLSGNPGNFDGMHTCDPSVVRVGEIYYLYYTGAAGDHALGNSIGLATSTDGVNWVRANGGRPILDPSRDVHRDNVYGAGQPSVVYLDGWFYLMFTDTTGRAAGWNGAGQFLLRSRDPAFASGVEALGAHGFAAVPGTSAPRTRSLVDGFSVDLMWVDSLEAFAIAHETQGGTTITFWNRDFTASPYRPLLIAGPWQEGPGLVRLPDGHAPRSAVDPCDQVPLDVVRATVIGSAGAPTDLRHFGLDVQGAAACEDPNRVLSALDGVAMPSPMRTMDLVTEGKVVRLDRRSVATDLADQVLNRRVPALDKFPVSARLPTAAKAVRAAGRGVGLVLDDGKLWPLSRPQAAALNDSPVVDISPQQWDAYPAGSPLGR
jgi:hypothetical protein